MNEPIFQILSTIICVINLIILVFAWVKFNWSDIYFSPHRLFILMALLDGFSNLYLVLNIEVLYNHVLSLIPSNMQSLLFVFHVLVLRVLINCICLLSICIGVKFGTRYKYGAFTTIVFDLTDKYFRSNSLLLVVCVSLAVYSTHLFFQSSGGFLGLWLNMGSRLELVGGTGYIQLVQYLFTCCAALTAILIFRGKSKPMSLITIAMCCVILLLGGQRSPVVYLVLSCIVFHSIQIKAVRNIWSIKLVLLSTAFVLSALIILNVREHGLPKNTNADQIFLSAIERFEEGFIARLGRIERDIVVTRYFEENNLWLGKSYLGLLTVAIPRDWLVDKPPADSGMYLRSLALGRHISPPMGISQLDGSSWPEGHYNGFMNFGYIGLFLFSAISSAVFGFIWSSIRKYRYPKLVTMISCIYFVTPFTLSPKDLVFLGTVFISLSLFTSLNIALHMGRTLLVSVK